MYDVTLGVSHFPAQTDTEIREITVGGLLREIAGQHGKSVALVDIDDAGSPGRSWTYSELLTISERLALALSTRFAPGEKVAVWAPNIPEWVFMEYACALAGLVLVTANPAYQAKELRYVLEHSEASGLFLVESYRGNPMADIAQEAIRDLEALREVIDLNNHEVLFRTGDKAGSLPTVQPGDAAQIQYTSGTTGFPKGCMLTHEYWMRASYSLAFTRGGAQHGIDNVLVWAPFFYMDGMWQLLSGFYLDATCYVARRMSMSQFFSWLIDYQIHTCTFPEPALKAFAPSSEDAKVCLKYIYAFGWRPESKRTMEERFPGCAARDAYGMTELGTATVTPMAAGERNFARTCGLEAPDRELKIVDDEGQEVARGERGELWVSGRGIMWGYYKRPEANREVFRGKWFRTGDIFYQNEDGYYFIVGRMKDMVKRAGENIAAREVEAVLNELDAIIESAIVPVPDLQRGEEVKAYVRLKEGMSQEDCSPADILAHCEAHLAKFKLPRYIAYVEDFPRTPTRKIAKQRMLAEAEDLTAGAFDQRDEIWR